MAEFTGTGLSDAAKIALGRKAAGLGDSAFEGKYLCLRKQSTTTYIVCDLMATPTVDAVTGKVTFTGQKLIAAATAGTYDRVILVGSVGANVISSVEQVEAILATDGTVTIGDITLAGKDLAAAKTYTAGQYAPASLDYTF